MALSSIYQIVFNQTYLTGGRNSQNVFFYDHTAGVGNASQLATAFAASIVAAINAIQTNVMKNVDLRIINLGNLADFANPAIVGIGSIGGATLPPHSSMSFTTKVNTRAVRHGGHRVSGVPESAQTNGVIDDDGYFASVELLRIAMQQELVSADDTWLPIVVGRVKEPVVGTVPLKYTYRLPRIDSELRIGEIVVALTTRNVGHQVSREL